MSTLPPITPAHRSSPPSALPEPASLARLSSPGDIVRAVPDLLGFRPEASIVVLCLHGRRHRLGMTARVDLPPPEWEEMLIDQLVARIRLESAAACAVVIYAAAPDRDPAGADAAPADTGGGAPAELPFAGLAGALDEALTESDVEVMELLHVAAGRWWSYRCTGPCCPPAGTPLDDGTTSVLAAANAVEGRHVFDDRETLVASVARAPGEPSVALLAALRARAAAADRRRPAELARARRRDREALGRLIEKRAAALAGANPPAGGVPSAGQGHPGGICTDRELARTAATLLQVPVLDIAGIYLGGRLEAAATQVWAEVLRRVPDPYAAAPATLLGLAAYRRGDGALARAYLDRALEDDPDHRVALLTVGMIDDGLRPDQLSTVLGLPGGGTLAGRGGAR